MELRQYFEILARYRVAVIVIPLVAALVALGATYAVTPRFIGIATVQLIPEEIEPRAVTLRSQDGVGTAALGVRDPTELLSQGIIENLDSREVAEMVVDELELDMLPPPQGFRALKAQVSQLIADAWAIARFGYTTRVSRREAAIAAVQGALKAEPVRGSYYMRISATWPNPEAASDIANAAVRALLIHTRGVAAGAATQQREFLDEQVEQASARLAQARTAMLQYSQDQGVIADVSVQAAVDALEVARREARENTLDSANLEAQLSENNRQSEVTPAEVIASRTTQRGGTNSGDQTLQSSAPNPVYQDLQIQVGQLRRDLAGMQERQGQEVQALRAQQETALADVRLRRATIEQQLSEPNIPELVYQTLKDQAYSLGQEIAALDGRRASEEAALLASQASELTDLRSRLSTAEDQLGKADPIVTTSDTLSSTGRNTPVEESVVALNPVYQQLRQQALALEQQLIGTRARQAELDAMVAQREQELSMLAVKDSRLAALNDELSLANQLYSRRMSQWFDAVLEETRPVNQVRLIDQAVAPLYPYQPIKYMWTLIGLAAGLVVATVLVFVRHATDISLRSAGAVQEVLQLPALAQLPAVHPRRSLAVRHEPRSRRNS